MTTVSYDELQFYAEAITRDLLMSEGFIEDDNAVEKLQKIKENFSNLKDARKKLQSKKENVEAIDSTIGLTTLTETTKKSLRASLKKEKTSFDELLAKDKIAVDNLRPFLSELGYNLLEEVTEDASDTI